MTFLPDAWLLNKCREFGIAEQQAQHLLNWCQEARNENTRPVAIVGAGMSRNAKPKPGWRELRRGISDEPRALLWPELAQKISAKLKRLGESETSDPLWLAELFEKLFGRHQLLRLLREAVPNDLLIPGECHACLVEIPWHALVTTNYDTLLERAFDSQRQPYTPHVCVTDEDLVGLGTRPASRPLIYLHGRLDRPNSIVVTLEDYRSYRRRHPGMYTKVRQLMLQHPLMLIGFGGTDPNFIQLSGWVGDILGRLRRRGIYLNVGDTKISPPRRLYWQDALVFVDVKKENLPELFKTIASFLVPSLQNALELTQQASDEIKQATSVADVISALQRAFEQIAEPTDPQMASIPQGELVNTSFRRVLELYEGAESAKQCWQRFERDRPNTSREEEARIRLEGLAAFRKAFGDEWARCLAVVVERLGRRFWVGEWSVVFVDAIEEVAHLSSAAPTLAQLKTILTENVLELAGNENPTDVVQRWIADVQLDQQQQEQIEDVLRRREFRAGSAIPGDEAGESAQALRRRAFFAGMHGHWQQSAELYARAAMRSREEGEPPLREWCTIDAALQTSDLLSNASMAEDPISKAPIAADQIDRLRNRRKALTPTVHGTAEWYVSDYERKARNEIIREQENAAISNLHKPHWEIKWQSDPSSGNLLAFDEQIWAHPSRAGNHAELLGVIQWQRGDAFEAARTLTRYGSKRLERLVSEAVERRAGLGARDKKKEFIDLLLTDGRWRPEWNAKIKPLTKLVPEMDGQQHERLSQWIATCEANRAANVKWCIQGGGLIYAGTCLSDPLAELLAVYLQYADPKELVDKWRRMESFSSDSKVSRASVIPQLHTLPWDSWLRTGKLAASDADEILAQAYDLMLEKSILGHVEHLILGLVSESEPLLPLDGRVASVVRQWLAAPPRQGVDDSYLRARLELAFLAPENARKQELARTILTSITEKPDFQQHLPSEKLRFLLHTLADVLVYLEPMEIEPFVLSLKPVFDLGIEGKRPDEKQAVAYFLQAIADVLAAALKCPVSQSTADACRQMLRSCILRSPFALEVVVELSSDLLGEMATEVREEISNQLAGQANPCGLHETHIQNVAISGIHGFCWQNQTDSLPVEWFHHLCFLARSETQEFARGATMALGLAAGKHKIADLADAWGDWRRAVCAAADDGRAYVQGAAGYALTLGLPNMPKEADAQGQAETALRRLEFDMRLGIQLDIDTAKSLLAAGAVR